MSRYGHSNLPRKGALSHRFGARFGPGKACSLGISINMEGRGCPFFLLGGGTAF